MEVMRSRSLTGFSLIVLVVFVGHPCCAGRREIEIDALNAFRAKADPGDVLHSMWTNGTDVCVWKGVEGCIDGRVTKLKLENYHLNGTFAEGTLSKLTQLRVLSLKGNGLTGKLPDMSGLINLKILFLDHNRFTGRFPESITTLHRLVIVDICYNQLSGPIPETLSWLPKLYVFNAENNMFNGSVPALNQSGLRLFNVSNNHLSGVIPKTVALASFNSSSFLGNPGLCGGPFLRAPCSLTLAPAYPAHPFHPVLPPATGRGGSKLTKAKIAGIAVGSVVGSVLGLAVILLIIFLYVIERENADCDGQSCKIAADGASPKQKGEAPVLIFCEGGSVQMYTMEDLLRASAEILGRGRIGITYRAVMDWGLMVTVKRLNNSSLLTSEEFERHMDAIGKLRHPNLISLRAYFHANEERLIIYDYQPNGSLYSFMHGSGPGSGGWSTAKPLHWTSCVKIAKEVASGLAYLHQAPTHNFHGNLHPSNILLGREMEVCLTDFGLTVLEVGDPMQCEDDDEGEGEGEGEKEEEEEGDDCSGSFVAYRAPECRLKLKKAMGPKADVYSFGILVFKLLTGKSPLPSIIQSRSSSPDHLPNWVRSVREQEMERAPAADVCLAVLVKVAVACVALSPDDRPTIAEILGMLEDVKDSRVSSDYIHGFLRRDAGNNSSSERSWSEAE